MKRLLTILLVLALPLLAFTMPVPIPRVTYFGNEVFDGASTLSSYAEFNNDATNAYICPGAGAQDVNSLEMYYKQGTGNIRCAIYTTSRVLVMQGSAQVAVAGGVDAWVGHTAFVDAAGTPIASPQLTGGTHYLLVTTADGADVASGCTAVASGNSKYISAEYTGGFPDPIAAGSNDTNLFSVRCGVTAAPAAGGGSKRLLTGVGK
jgi:hypothetical protein